MKKLTLAICAATALSILGCKKEVKQPDQNTKPKLSTISGHTPIYYNYGVDITEADFLINLNDAADTRFNQINHAMTLSIMKLMNNNSGAIPDLIAAATANAGKMVNLYEFASTHPEINQTFDEVFQTRFEGFSSDWQSYVEENYYYDTTYTPFVRIVNWDNYDDQLSPYLCAPNELNEEKFTQFDDDYPLWMPDVNKKMTLFSTLNTTRTKQIDNPILAVINSFPGDEYNDGIYLSPDNPYDSGPYTGSGGGLGVGGSGGGVTFPVYLTSCDLNPLPIQHKHETITQTHFKIDHGYENWGKSEYTTYVVIKRGYDPAADLWGPYPGAGQSSEWQNKFKVPKSQVGNLLTWNHDLFKPEKLANPACFDIDRMLSQSVWEYFGFAAFEWDAIHSGKDLGTVRNQYGAYVKYKGQRKYKHEIYFFEPDLNTRFEFTNYFPTTNSTYTNNYKGQLILSRHF